MENPASTSVLFARGVIARLATWETLRLAVQDGWGGPEGSEKRTWMASVIVDAFEETVPPPDDQYIEEMILQIMADEFDANVEDGSGEQVAVDITRLWEETRSGKEDLVMQFEDNAEKIKGKMAVAEYQTPEDDEGNEDDEDDWEDEGLDEMSIDEAPELIDRSSKNEPEVDDEGFTMVKRKR